MGKKLGDGGFGVVFKAELKEDNGEKTEVVVKKVFIIYLLIKY